MSFQSPQQRQEPPTFAERIAEELQQMSDSLRQIGSDSQGLSRQIEDNFNHHVPEINEGHRLCRLIARELSYRYGEVEVGIRKEYLQYKLGIDKLLSSLKYSDNNLSFEVQIPALIVMSPDPINYPYDVFKEDQIGIQALTNISLQGVQFNPRLHFAIGISFGDTSLGQLYLAHDASFSDTGGMPVGLLETLKQEITKTLRSKLSTFQVFPPDTNSDPALPRFEFFNSQSVEHLAVFGWVNSNSGAICVPRPFPSPPCPVFKPTPNRPPTSPLPNLLFPDQVTTAHVVVRANTSALMTLVKSKIREAADNLGHDIQVGDPVPFWSDPLRHFYIFVPYTIKNGMCARWGYDHEARRFVCRERKDLNWFAFIDLVFEQTKSADGIRLFLRISFVGKTDPIDKKEIPIGVKVQRVETNIGKDSTRLYILYDLSH